MAISQGFSPRWESASNECVEKFIVKKTLKLANKKETLLKTFIKQEPETGDLERERQIRSWQFYLIRKILKNQKVEKQALIYANIMISLAVRPQFPWISLSVCVKIEVFVC